MFTYYFMFNYNFILIKCYPKDIRNRTEIVLGAKYEYNKSMSRQFYT